MVYVYDITGPLRDWPLMIADSRIPEMADHGMTQPVDPGPGECPEATVAIDYATRRMSVQWTIGALADGSDVQVLRADRLPYAITSLFQSQADYCLLVPDTA